MDITFINVGYGEAILVTCKDPGREDGQFVMLIDGGSAIASEYEGNSGRIEAYRFLQKKEIRHIDILVSSHVHEDHTSGLLPVLSRIPAGELWTSIRIGTEFYGKHTGPLSELTETNRKALTAINDYCLIMELFKDRKVTFYDGILPDHFHTGDLAIDILGPEKNYKQNVEKVLAKVMTAREPEEQDAAITEATESINNASLILRLHYKGHTVLLCGDTNAKGFRYIIEAAPELLKADVFKTGHHGQPDSVTEELVRAVDPSVIVCCASNDHRSNSSDEKTFETIRKALGEKPVTYLFQDGLYNEKWNPETSPRNGVNVHIGDDVISWSLC